ncbi:MAG: SDR family oxidoreductase [Actinobacteria bacterium]|nr:SDR family oxidoreductase [Actinomycetota bacterium]
MQTQQRLKLRPPGELAGKVAIITGASSGIGAVTARELARRGASVVLAARRTAELRGQASSIAASGGRSIAIPTDISDPRQVEELVARSHDAYGRIDVLVNNAAIAWYKPFIHGSADEIQQIADINLTGAILMTRAVLPGMLAQGYGSVINVSSVGGRVAVEPLYSATKYGVRGFSLSLRRQLAGTEVSVSLVSPGNIRTQMNRNSGGRMPGPEVVAKTIADLVRRPRREVVVPSRYRAIVWLEQGFPDFADLAYQWRHRHDALEESKRPPAVGGDD